MRAAGLALCVLTLGVLTLALAPVAHAQDSATAERDRLFGELLQNPMNLELNLRYARSAAALGDAETAVAALERILTANPAQPAVRLQIGLLYLRLGSPAAARSYLEPLTADADPAIGKAAAAALDDASKLASRHKFSGLVSLGVQMQSDPAAVPASPLVLAGGAPTIVSSSFTKSADTDIFTQLQGVYDYDLGTEYGDTLEVTGVGSSQSFRKLHRLDLIAGTLAAGPRIASEHLGIAGGSLRPYALISDVQLGGAHFYGAWGGGLSYVQSLGSGWPRLSFDYEVQQQTYHATANYPTANLFSGRLDHYAIGATQPLGSIASLSLAGAINRDNTQASFYRSTDYLLAGTVAVGLHPGFLDKDGPWVTKFTLGRHYVSYDAPDPSVAPTIKRGDRRWQFGVSETVPLTDGLSLALAVFRDINSSNILNYAYGNSSVLAGLQFAF